MLARQTACSSLRDCMLRLQVFSLLRAVGTGSKVSPGEILEHVVVESLIRDDLLQS